MLPCPPLVYILGEFPAASQTFVRREIRSLVELGVDIRVFALGRGPMDCLEAEDRAWLQRARWAPAWPTPAVLGSHIHYLRRAPGRYLKTLFTLAGLPHRRLYLFRALYVFLRLPWIARQVPEGAHIHAHFATGQTEMALGLACLLDASFSFTAHARDIYAVPNALEEKLRRARFVVTGTRTNRDYFYGLCPDLPPDRVRTIRHGTDLARLQADPRGEEPPLILSAARFVPKKGLDTLVRACGRLHAQGLDFRCLLVGEGPEQDRLERLIRELGLQAKVELPGWMPFSRLAEWYPRARVFALPCRVDGKRDQDGLPTVLIEALAAGVPAVSTPVSGVGEVVEDGATGFLVPPDDPEKLAEALGRLLREPELAAALGREGRRRVRAEFDPASIALELRDLFASAARPVR